MQRRIARPANVISRADAGSNQASRFNASRLQRSLWDRSITSSLPPLLQPPPIPLLLPPPVWHIYFHLPPLPIPASELLRLLKTFLTWPLPKLSRVSINSINNLGGKFNGLKYDVLIAAWFPSDIGNVNVYLKRTLKRKKVRLWERAPMRMSSFLVCQTNHLVRCSSDGWKL